MGAWVCASGNQVWNGQIGTLMANPRNVTQNNTDANVAALQCQPNRAFTSAANAANLPASSPWAARARSSMKSNVPVARYKKPKATSMPMLPASV